MWFKRVLGVTCLFVLAACSAPLVIGGGSGGSYKPEAQLQVAGGAPLVVVSQSPIQAAGHACVLLDGKVACWGANNFRQLAQSGGNSCKSLDCFLSPCWVQNLPPVRSVAVGESTTCAITPQGEVWCWGEANMGQLGADPQERCGNDLNVWPCSHLPVKIQGLPPVTTMAVSSHICAISETGEVWCWGSNGSGALGTKSSEACVPNLAVSRDDMGRERPMEGLGCSRSPLRLEGLGGVVQVVSGRSHSCALTNRGEVTCWGSNHRGELGIGSNAEEAPPTRVNGLADVASLTAGMVHTCAVTRGGDLYCWGANDVGQLGFEARDKCMSLGFPCSRVPGKVLSGITDAGAGFTHSCARHADGSVSCWGLDTDGQLGFQGKDKCNRNTQVCSLFPQKVPTLAQVSALSVGYGFSCVVQDRQVQCWGRNVLGALGDGSTRSRSEPRPVDNPTVCH
ncbi:MAG: hypothetical protein IPK82_15200 [Polyangiaceae bacterium]|nr:hypothetical protein [Polyangiaceae bacterium]